MRWIRWLALVCLVVTHMTMRTTTKEGTETSKTQTIVGSKETKTSHRADCKWVEEIESWHETLR
jgi:hypothetical protein